VVGWLIAKKVQMTAMPEMVSLFNGMGGACAMLISVIEFKHLSETDMSSVEPAHLLIILLGLIIGSVSFAGSIIAWGKLSGNVKDKSLGMQQVINIGLLLVILVLTAVMIFGQRAYTA
jgi:H+-translocating NAD(P) transhydrogenase subunit beta